MSDRPGLIRTIATLIAAIVAIAVIVAVLTGHGHHHGALGGHHCPPGTHWVYINPAIYGCKHSIWHWSSWHWPWD